MARISLAVVLCLGLVGLSSCHSLGELKEDFKERFGERFGEKLEKYMDKVGDKIEHLKERFQRQWEDWEYEGEFGFKHWAKHVHACGNHAQSPINLPHYHEHEKHDDLGDIDFSDDLLDDDVCELENDGRVVKANCDFPSKSMVVSGGGLPGDFVLAQFNFHWGKDDHEGSEHAIEGVHYPMEMQIVAYNLKYDDLEEAKKHHDGLAMMGVFFKVAHGPESASSESVSSESESSSNSSSGSFSSSSSGSSSSASSSSSNSSSFSSSLESSESMSSESNSSSSSASSESFSSSASSASSSGSSSSGSSEEEVHKQEDVEKVKPLVDEVKKITKPGSKSTVSKRQLRSLLPGSRTRFYRYLGSLTSPPCNHAIWTVFRQPVYITEEQLEHFRSLIGNHYQQLVNNYRPLQMLHDRHIHLN